MMIKATCDSCGMEFLVDSAAIRETTLDLDEGLSVVSWFACPNEECKKVYLVAVMDPRWVELKVDLESQVARVKKLYNKKQQKKAEAVGLLIDKKKDRISKHVEKLKKKYNGRFTLVSTENETEDIRMLP